MYNNSSLSSIVYGGIFMALTILFTYVFAIQTTFIRVDFAFIPICLYAMRSLLASLHRSQCDGRSDRRFLGCWQMTR